MRRPQSFIASPIHFLLAPPEAVHTERIVTKSRIPKCIHPFFVLDEHVSSWRDSVDGRRGGANCSGCELRLQVLPYSAVLGHQLPQTLARPPLQGLQREKGNPHTQPSPHVSEARLFFVQPGSSPPRRDGPHNAIVDSFRRRPASTNYGSGREPTTPIQRGVPSGGPNDIPKLVACMEGKSGHGCKSRLAMWMLCLNSQPSRNRVRRASMASMRL